MAQVNDVKKRLSGSGGGCRQAESVDLSDRLEQNWEKEDKGCKKYRSENRRQEEP
jgi:hypothetical protein